ncbi:hypothetical protein UFOVP24_36 [uncultured Caudovirales phage]|uniref:Uncharacterized protein n=1 Tax=uncultured Caudovirales phage TaxID=2100421 RepID=A0A6J5T896_9CAUD|nr:hypothetical protein UFOVP24_36 [uncultured Caudovirales phage]
MATMPNTNINIPYSAFIDESTGRPTQAWLLWLMSPNFITVNLGSALAVTSGGTGLTTIPTNGQLLIGNGSGYTLNTLGTGVGISVVNGAGTITIANTGVLSNIAGSGISVSSATGDVTIANTGVLSFSGGTTGLTPATATTGNVTLGGTLIAVNGGTGQSLYAVGDLLYADTTTTLAKLPDVATGNALISGGISTAPAWGKIGLTTHVSGVLPIANGGTNGSATPTTNGIAYGTGTAYAFTAAGTTGQVLTATTGGAPTWAAPAASGTVTSVSVVSANGFAGTVATSTTTPAITLTTSVTGVLKGNGTAISAAVVNTDYLAPSAPVTKTANFTVADTDVWLINNKTGSTCTVTLPAASSWSGRVLRFLNYQVQTLVSASSNVVPLTGGSAATSILLASTGDSATLVSDGTNWLMTQYIPNNILLLE